MIHANYVDYLIYFRANIAMKAVNTKVPNIASKDCLHVLEYHYPKNIPFCIKAC